MYDIVVESNPIDVLNRVMFSEPSNLIRNNWSHFENFALNYLKKEEINENTTINNVWRKENVQLFTPLPSLALHMQYAQNIDKMVDWKELWDMIPDMA